MNIGSMTVQDGPQWSPDGGKLWAKNNIVYWEDGDVTDLNKNPYTAFRLMPGGYEHAENYSEWTPEHRAMVWAESKERYRKNREAEAAEKAARERLRESARQKLSPEEIEACGLSA